MHGKTILSPALAAIIGLFSGSCIALADPGVSAGKIVFGQAGS